MQKVLIAAFCIALTGSAFAAEADERNVPAREAAVGEVLAPRPGDAIRETSGSTAPHVVSPGRVKDDRLIVEERPPSVSPQRCPAGASPADCAR